MTSKSAFTVPAILCEVMIQEGIPAEMEVKFHPSRKFRIDVAVVSVKLAIEVNGGVWSSGRHTRGAGYLRDMEKLNLLTEMGWRTLQYSTQEAKDLSALPQIKWVYNRLKEGTL